MFGQGPNQTSGNPIFSTQGPYQLGQKSMGQMPYMAGTNDPIGQTPKQMGGDFPQMGQGIYMTGSNQASQGVQRNSSGPRYLNDLKDLNSKENWY